MDNALLIFAKKPELGKVKTRLAKDIGDEKALLIYKKLLFYTFDMAEQCEVYSMACLTEKDQITLDTIPYSGFYLQEEGDLGHRMYKAFEHTKTLGFNKIVVIGTDCPDLTKEIVDEAFEALENHDFVIGPATDGGYYLLGMSSAKEYIFKDVAWSTKTVLSSTIERIGCAEETYFLLQTLNDIDTLEDLNNQKKFKPFL